MTIHSFLLGMTLATLIGALFHLWQGGNFKKILAFFLLSCTGFWVGQIVAKLTSLELGEFGQLSLVVDVLFSLMFLLVGNWILFSNRSK